MTPLEIAMTIAGFAMACAIITFVFIGENYAFSFAERFFMAGTTAYTSFAIYKSLKSSFFDFVIAGRVWLVIPFFIGLLTFARMTKWRWAARYPVAIMSGIGLGLFFGLNLRAQILTIVTSTVSELIGGKPDPVSAIFVLITVVTVLTYFLYSERFASPFHSRTGKLYYVMRTGRLLMMLSFGYLTGQIMTSTVGGIVNFLVVVVKRSIEALLTG